MYESISYGIAPSKKQGHTRPSPRDPKQTTQRRSSELLGAGSGPGRLGAGLREAGAQKALLGRPLLAELRPGPKKRGMVLRCIVYVLHHIYIYISLKIVYIERERERERQSAWVGKDVCTLYM